MEHWSPNFAVGYFAAIRFKFVGAVDVFAGLTIATKESRDPIAAMQAKAAAPTQTRLMHLHQHVGRHVPTCPGAGVS